MRRPAGYFTGLVCINLTGIEFPTGVEHRRVIDEVVLRRFESILHDGITLKHIRLGDTEGDVGVAAVFREQ